MMDWRTFRETTDQGEPDEAALLEIKRRTDEYLASPEGRAEVEELAAELRGDDPQRVIELYTDRTCGGNLEAGRREIFEIAQQLLKESSIMEQSTEGIVRADVEDAMAYLGIANPKPEIPLDTTVSGHDIVAVARRFRQMDDRMRRLEAIVERHFGGGKE